MIAVNYWAVVVAALAAFVMSSAWYIAFSKPMLSLHGGDTSYIENAAAWKKLAVTIGGFVLALVLAQLVVHLGIRTWLDAALLGVGLWIGFALVQWVGSIMWERVPVKLAAIHAGDWLVKVVLIAVIVGVWR